MSCASATLGGGGKAEMGKQENSPCACSGAEEPASGSASWPGSSAQKSTTWPRFLQKGGRDFSKLNELFNGRLDQVSGMEMQHLGFAEVVSLANLASVSPSIPDRHGLAKVMALANPEAGPRAEPAPEVEEELERIWAVTEQKTATSGKTPPGGYQYPLHHHGQHPDCRGVAPVRVPVLCSEGSVRAFADRFGFPVARMHLAGDTVLSCCLIRSDIVISSGHGVRQSDIGFETNSRVVLNDIDGRPGRTITYDILRLLDVNSNEPFDFAIWEIGLFLNRTSRVPGRPREESEIRASVHRLLIRAWVLPTGISIRAIGYPASSAGQEIAAATLLSNSTDCGAPVISGQGCYEAEVNSVPGFSGAPWMDTDGCVFAINMEGARDARVPFTDLDMSWASRLDRIIQVSPVLRAVVRETARRGRNCVPYWLETRSADIIVYREQEFGSVMMYWSESEHPVETHSGDWQHHDISSLFGMPQAMRGAHFSSWRNNTGLTCLAYISGGGWTITLGKLTDHKTWSPEIIADIGNRRPLLPEVVHGFLTEGASHIVVMSSLGTLIEVYSVRGGQWMSRVIDDDADTATRSMVVMQGLSRERVDYDDEGGPVESSLVFRRANRMFCHKRYSNGRWVELRNPPIARELTNVTLAFANIPSHWANGTDGIDREYLFCLGRTSGDDSSSGVLHCLKYDRDRDRWSSVDIVRAANAPEPDPQHGVSAISGMVVLNDDPLSYEETPAVSVCYTTMPQEAGSRSSLVILMKVGAGRWHIRGTSDLDNLFQAGRMGTSNGKKHCLLTMSGLVGIVDDHGHGMAAFTCISERSGLPYGWEYFPGGHMSPKRLPPEGDE